MADLNPQSQEKIEPNVPAAQPPQDYFSILLKVIQDVSKDPVQLRKLVYALAWQNLKPEAIVARPIAGATENARTIAELDRALALEEAIERVEAVAAQQPQMLTKPPVEPPATEAPPVAKAVNPPSEDEPPVRENPNQWDPNPFAKEHFTKEPWTTQPSTEKPWTEEPAVMADEFSVPPESQEPAAEPTAEPVTMPPSGNAVVIVPERPPAWLERTDRTLPERLPPWMDHGVRVSLDSVEYAPIQRQQWAKPAVWNFIQLVGAAIVGVALYVGISGWVYLGRQPASAPPAPPAQVAAPAPSAPSVASETPAAPVQPKPEPQPLLPFPLPKTYGVYAGSNGQLVELDQLPIKVPDPRVLLSAEVTKPSTTSVAGDNLAFLVFRRDLVNSAPQTVPVRVVASVKRAMRFIDGKPVVRPIEGQWRIRAKSFDFKVSPFEANREMIVIQPDPGFVFPAGRYALVLNGFGYDFTVAGPVIAPEQCLELVEIVNGSVLSECPKS